MTATRSSTSRSKPTTGARTSTSMSESKTADEQFAFDHPDTGVQCHLPSRIRFGVLRKALKAGEGDIEQIIAILEQVADADAIDAIDAMTVPDVNQLVARWQEAIGAGLGDT